MGQIREPNTATRKNNGMILARLPPGEWHTGWVRDATYAVVALARSGHIDEAKAALNFFLNARRRRLRQLREQRQDYRISLMRYFGNGAGGGRLEQRSAPNIEIDGWGLFLWARAPVRRGLGRHRAGCRRRRAGGTVYDVMKSGVAEPLEANLETLEHRRAPTRRSGRSTSRASTSPSPRWRRRAASATWRRWRDKAGKAADVTHYQALVAEGEHGAFGRRSSISRWRSAARSRGSPAHNYYDGAVAEAVHLEPARRLQRADREGDADRCSTICASAGRLQAQRRRAQRRTTPTSGSWSTCASPTRSAAPGKTAKADGCSTARVSKAAANFNLLPELYNDTCRRRRRSASTPARSRWSATAPARTS